MTPLFTSTEEAENAFYEAIAHLDLDAFMQIWSDDEEIVCIHPTGQYLRGEKAIRESWQAIFSGNPRLFIHVARNTRWGNSLLTAHSIVETLHFENEKIPRGSLLVTHVFQRGANGWRLLMRHASMGSEAGTPQTPELAQRILH